MKRFLPILLLVGALGCQRVTAEPQQTNDCQTCPVDQRDCNTCPVLPEDGRAWHFSLMLNKDWRKREADRRLVSWVYGHQTIVGIKSQCHVHLYTPSNKIYQERFAKIFDGHRPGLFIQRDDGVPVVTVASDALVQMRSADELAACICGPIRSYKRMLRNNRNSDLTPEAWGDRRRRGGCQPEPEPQPDEPDIVDESSIMAEPIVTPPVQDSGPWMWIAVVLGVILFACFVFMICVVDVSKMAYEKVTRPLRATKR